MLLDQDRAEVVLFEHTNPQAQGFKNAIPACDITYPMPQNVAGDVARRTNRIPAEAPPTAKSKTKVQIRPDKGKGKGKGKAGSGGGRRKGDGHSDDEGRAPGRGGGDGGGVRTLRATRKKEPEYRYFWIWACHECVDHNGHYQSGGMTTMIEQCPNPKCQHTRCECCPVEQIRKRTS